ncbi:tyrosine-type recombinase/integrase [Desulfosporosinus sp. HMP52]|uniref:tyrosine-type recombinase/integrase n=1 Tax=Desulfosporosinus sp. HMP52 TaxID=1487923 RepID=UPI0013F3DAFD|nr:tyrosine-type recombinase/integrase [Desulfosporosinus sp. HMP52]
MKSRLRGSKSLLLKMKAVILNREIQSQSLPRDIALITLMLNTGLRISEVAALDIEDLTIGDRSGSLKVRMGKGGKFRTVPLNSDTRKALCAYLNGRTNGPIFLSQRGKGTGRLTSSGIRQVIDQVRISRQTARFTSSHPADTFAQNLIKADEGLEMVAEVLGHKSLNTTNIYTQPSEQDKANAVEKLSLSH